MRYFFLLLFPFLLNAQNDELKELNSLEENEKVVIDITIGGCFTATTATKVLITKKGKQYEFIYIENIYSIIYKINEKVLLYPEKLEKWIKTNIQRLAKEGKRTILTEKEYQLKIETLGNTIKTFDNCTSKFVGQYSTIKINSKRLKYRKNFECNIILLDFADN